MRYIYRASGSCNFFNYFTGARGSINITHRGKAYSRTGEHFLATQKGNYNVSSDIIESIFGKHKSIVSTNQLVGMTILDLELSVHCQNKKDIPDLVKVALQEISMANLFNWRATHSADNQALKRKLWFKKRA